MWVGERGRGECGGGVGGRAGEGKRKGYKGRRSKRGGGGIALWER